MTVFQAFIDDSRNDKSGNFVLAGHIATAEDWADLAREWEGLLPTGGILDADRRYHFHMTEMAGIPERMARVPAFFWLIEKHVLLSLSCTVNIRDLQRAKARIWVPHLKIDWGFLNNPYLFAWRALMDMFHTNKHLIDQILPTNQKVDFYFDKQSEKGIILKIWDEYVAKRPDHVRNLFGVRPHFEDDKEFMPLQAADLWAWWVRKWFDDCTPEKIEHCDFGKWRSTRTDYPKIAISISEDDIVKFMIETMREQLEPGRIIYDVRFSTPW